MRDAPFKFAPGQEATFLISAHSKHGVRCTILEPYGDKRLNFRVRLEDPCERMPAGTIYIAGVSQLRPCFADDASGPSKPKGSAMSDMVERAAKAIWWANRCEGLDTPWEDRREPMKDETRKEARAALLAALDPGNAALVENFGRDFLAAVKAEAKHVGYLEEREGGEAMARIALTVLRNYTAQGETNGT